MGNLQEHTLIALQLNLGAKKRSNGGYVSKHIGRYVISQYLEQSIIFDPAFIALHDDFSTVDAESIRDAFKTRTQQSDVTYHSIRGEPLKPKPNALLLYNTSIMTYDSNITLEKDDFFIGRGKGRDTKARKLFERLDGGLFQHEQSKQFIVAVSYHGEHTQSSDEKKDNVFGGLTTISMANIKS
jgi:hypothetical protein